ncbi:MAG: J domain-containing protein [Nannocystaceae bacterium]|nr:J domain-containing protein [Nannocystaceae bacterium]
MPKSAPRAAPDPVPESEVAVGESSAHGTDALERIERRKVGRDDPRVDSGSPIDVERQRWILAMADGHESMSQFEILGILPTHDTKAIKRAFHDASRGLHPDAYHGRDLGAFRPILASLFREAKAAYGELRRADIRAPWVDRRIEDDARARLQFETEAAEARVAREAAAAVRREERTRVRAQRQRGALQKKMQAEAGAMLQAAETAEKDGNLAKAANLYLLAMRADPGNEQLAAKWDAVRGAAREKRGAAAYARAQQRLDLGQAADAIPWLLEAADAMPTAEHLAHAAFFVRQGDPKMARDLAMRALEALRTTEAAGSKVRPADAVRLHVWIGYAFLAAGQVSTAKHQVEQALKLKPDDADVRALLKACKAK